MTQVTPESSLNRVENFWQLTLSQETVGQRLLGQAVFPTINATCQPRFVPKRPLRRSYSKRGLHSNIKPAKGLGRMFAAQNIGGLGHRGKVLKWRGSISEKWPSVTDRPGHVYTGKCRLLQCYFGKVR